MTGIDVIELEFFTMVYTLVVMHKLIREGLLIVTAIPSISTIAWMDTITELGLKYPLPTYDVMADYGYRMIQAHKPVNTKLSFTQEDLYKLFVNIEANNGYIL